MGGYAIAVLKHFTSSDLLDLILSRKGGNPAAVLKLLRLRDSVNLLAKRRKGGNPAAVLKLLRLRDSVNLLAKRRKGGNPAAAKKCVKLQNLGWDKLVARPQMAAYSTYLEKRKPTARIGIKSWNIVEKRKILYQKLLFRSVINSQY